MKKLNSNLPETAIRPETLLESKLSVYHVMLRWLHSQAWKKDEKTSRSELEHKTSNTIHVSHILSQIMQ